MDLKPKVTDEGFYEKYPNYDVLVSSLEIPKGLKVFEVVCPPRKLSKITNKLKQKYELDENILSNVTTLGENDLYSDFNCLICFSILQRTMVVKDCLHRFCGDCIEKCVRIGLRECPQCRLHIASRRSLRNDSIMDTLTFRLFPEATEFEKKYQEILIANNKKQQMRTMNKNEIYKTKNIFDGYVNNKDNHENSEILEITLKPADNIDEELKIKNMVTYKLKLPSYVKLNFMKQYLLGKFRNEKPDVNFEVQLIRIIDHNDNIVEMNQIVLLENVCIAELIKNLLLHSNNDRKYEIKLENLIVLYNVICVN